MGVGCPCPPVRDDIVTPRYIFFFSVVFSFYINYWEKNRKTFFDFLSPGLGINVSLFRLGQFGEVVQEDLNSGQPGHTSDRHPTVPQPVSGSRYACSATACDPKLAQKT